MLLPYQRWNPRAPGIAAGQSARTTTATYFDYQGIMRTAQPGELRPKFVYKNGVWVQDGYLRETASKNLFQMDTTHADQNGRIVDSYNKYAYLSGFTPDTCPDGVSRNVKLTSSSNPSVCFVSKAPMEYDATKSTCVSFYMKVSDADNGHNIFTFTMYAPDISKSCGQNMYVKGSFYPLWDSANTAGFSSIGDWVRYWFVWESGNNAGGVLQSSADIALAVSAANDSWPYSKSIWGVQIEQDVLSPSSLIENTDIQMLVRAAD